MLYRSLAFVEVSASLSDNSMYNYSFDYMYRDKVLAHVVITEEPFSCTVTNYTDNPIFRPFGVKTRNITMRDLQKFYASRCFPNSRVGRDNILSAIGVVNYSPSLIIRRNHGVMLEDHCWIKFEGEDLTYERDIKPRR